MLIDSGVGDDMFIFVYIDKKNLKVYVFVDEDEFVEILKDLVVIFILKKS